MSPRRNFLRLPDPMDVWLESQGYYRKAIAKDGSCLFRAVAEQLFYTQAEHHKIRVSTIKFMERNKEKFECFIEGPFDHYLFRLQDLREWGGHVEMCAMSLLYRRDFCVFQEVGRLPYQATSNGFPEVIRVCFSQGNHYDSVYTRSHIATTGMCQSIAYEILYKNVFDLGDPVGASQAMLQDNRIFPQRTFVGQEGRMISDSPSPDIFDEQSMDGSMKKGGKDSSGRETPEESVESVLCRPPFSYKVAKALSFYVYRNIDLDTWREGTRGDTRYNGHYRPREMPMVGNTNQLEVGGKCLLKLSRDGEIFCYNVHIQEMAPNKGPVTVYIEEKGEKRTVAFEDLQPLPRTEVKVYSAFKHYKQLSGYYQKTPVMLPEYAGRGKKSKMNKGRNKGKEGYPPVGMVPGGAANPTRMGGPGACSPAPHVEMGHANMGRGGRGRLLPRSVSPKLRFPAANVHGVRMNSHPGGLNLGGRHNQQCFQPINPDDNSAFPALPKVNGNVMPSVPVSQMGQIVWNGRPPISGTPPLKPVIPVGIDSDQPPPSIPVVPVPTPPCPPSSKCSVAHLFGSEASALPLPPTPLLPAAGVNPTPRFPSPHQAHMPLPEAPQQMQPQQMQPQQMQQQPQQPMPQVQSQEEEHPPSSSYQGGPEDLTPMSGASSPHMVSSPPMLYPNPASSPAISAPPCAPYLTTYPTTYAANLYGAGSPAPFLGLVQQPLAWRAVDMQGNVATEDMSGMKYVYSIPYEQPYPGWNYQTSFLYTAAVPPQAACAQGTSVELTEIDDRAVPTFLSQTQDDHSEDRSAAGSPQEAMSESGSQQVASLAQDLQQGLVLTEGPSSYFSMPPPPTQSHQAPGFCYYSTMVPPPPLHPPPHMPPPPHTMYLPPTEEYCGGMAEDSPRSNNQHHHNSSYQRGGRQQKQQRPGSSGANVGQQLPPRFQKNASVSHYAHQRFQFEGMPLLQMAAGGHSRRQVEQQPAYYYSLDGADYHASYLPEQAQSPPPPPPFFYQPWGPPPPHVLYPQPAQQAPQQAGSGGHGMAA